MSMVGTVEKIKEGEGYGYVRSHEDGETYFFIVEDVEFGEPSVGDELTFEPFHKDGKNIAKEPWNIEDMEVRL